MNTYSLQSILSELFGEGAGPAESIAQTDRGAVWAFSLRGDFQHARDNWERLRQAMSAHELWPLVVLKHGEEEEMRLLARAHAVNTDHENHDSFAILAEGLEQSAESWASYKQEAIERQRAEYRAYLQRPQSPAPWDSSEYQESKQRSEELDDFADENPFEDEDEEAAAFKAKYDGVEARHRAWLASPEGAEARADKDGHVFFDAETGITIDYSWGDYGEADAELPEAEALDDLEAPTVRRWRPPDSIWIMLVPARQGWEVPATLGFGGWNACPWPQKHVALLHHWHQKYGADLVGLSHDQMLFTVQRPPQNPDEALPLAHQHFHFCSGEGWGSDDRPEMLVDGLVNRQGWWFWWD